MDKIEHPGQNLSLRKSLIFYIAAFAILAFILSIVTFLLCNNATDKIRSSYPLTGEKYYLTNEQGEQFGNGTFIGGTTVPMSKQDERLIALLDLIPGIAAPVYSALCIMAASLLFYRNKLKIPLTELSQASEKIANNDLDFSIEYDSKDELGRLCTSFEIMRTTLADNFSEMWRQVEERKQLNAAFAHDLLSNAVRYAKTTVTLSFTLQDDLFLLSVSDDGKGFDKNNLHKATAPYFTEETDRSEHFGLGLYICKLLCEHHGGCLKIDNIPNGSKVSAFFKFLPCR